jgi:hypothetical protein
MPQLARQLPSSSSPIFSPKFVALFFSILHEAFVPARRVRDDGLQDTLSLFLSLKLLNLEEGQAKALVTGCGNHFCP